MTSFWYWLAVKKIVNWFTLKVNSASGIYKNCVVVRGALSSPLVGGPLLRRRRARLQMFKEQEAGPTLLPRDAAVDGQPNTMPPFSASMLELDFVKALQVQPRPQGCHHPAGTFVLIGADVIDLSLQKLYGLYGFEEHL